MNSKEQICPNRSIEVRIIEHDLLQHGMSEQEFEEWKAKRRKITVKTRDPEGYPDRDGALMMYCEPYEEIQDEYEVMW